MFCRVIDRYSRKEAMTRQMMSYYLRIYDALMAAHSNVKNLFFVNNRNVTYFRLIPNKNVLIY